MSGPDTHERVVAFVLQAARRYPTRGNVGRRHAEANRVRVPAWSGALTVPLAAVIRPEWRVPALAIIKAFHTAIFATIGVAIALAVWDGLLQTPRQRTLIAGGMVLVESAIYASNNQVCPLTPLAEQLGARRGSVSDIFLPDWLSTRIPVVGGSAMLLGLALNAWAGLRQRSINRWANATSLILQPGSPR